MCSPLSPVLANLYIKHFEDQAINSFSLKLKRGKRFVDDTDVVWPHGESNLKLLFSHPNNQNESIKFTIEKEDVKSIPFMDVLVLRKDNGTLSHQVFKNKTHTNMQLHMTSGKKRYLHTTYHHFPSQKHGIISTLVTRTIRIFDEGHMGT